MDLLDLQLILSAVGGGIFGAALGPLPAFIFCGVVVLAGEVALIAAGTGVITTSIGFGTFFGPHIAFAGGVAAAAYAARKGYLGSGRDILTPLMKLGRWDVLLVGGIFGVGAFFINGLLAETGMPSDTIAITVIISAIIARILWSDTGVFGRHDPKKSSSRWRPPEEVAWLPFQMHFGQLLLIGLGMGLASAYVTILTGSLFFGYGIAAASLIILEIKGAGPVTHHIALPASIGAIATGSIVMGGVFGILGAFAGEFFARLFYDWGDTHIDPPACAIAVLTTVAILFLGYA